MNVGDIMMTKEHPRSLVRILRLAADNYPAAVCTAKSLHLWLNDEFVRASEVYFAPEVFAPLPAYSDVFFFCDEVYQRVFGTQDPRSKYPYSFVFDTEYFPFGSMVVAIYRVGVGIVYRRRPTWATLDHSLQLDSLLAAFIRIDPAIPTGGLDN